MKTQLSKHALARIAGKFGAGISMTLRRRAISAAMGRLIDDSYRYGVAVGSEQSARFIVALDEYLSGGLMLHGSPMRTPQGVVYMVDLDQLIHNMTREGGVDRREELYNMSVASARLLLKDNPDAVGSVRKINRLLLGTPSSGDGARFRVAMGKDATPLDFAQLMAQYINPMPDSVMQDVADFRTSVREGNAVLNATIKKG